MKKYEKIRKIAELLAVEDAGFIGLHKLNAGEVDRLLVAVVALKLK